MKSKQILKFYFITTLFAFYSMDQRLRSEKERYIELTQKYDEAIQNQIDKEADYIKENSQLMSQNELLINEKLQMQSRLDESNDQMQLLNDQIRMLKVDNIKEIQYFYIKSKNHFYREYEAKYTLKERDLNLSNIKKIGQYKLDIENLENEKQKIELNYNILQNENMIKQNNNDKFVLEKQQNKLLTNKLLDTLRLKLMEKHHSGKILKSSFDNLQATANMLTTENEELKSALEGFQEIDRAIQGASSMKCKSCLKLISTTSFISHIGKHINQLSKFLTHHI